MFSNILVVTDGSDHGTRAVEAAATIAGKFDANLTIGHVLLHGEPPSAFRRMSKVEHLTREPAMQKPNVGNIPGGLVAYINKAEEERISHDIMEALAERITAHAKDIAKEAGASKVAVKLEDGDSANRILKMAESIDADLIVMGTRGFGPIKSLLMGSTSQKVTQLAKCACLTVK